mmetsp:Transcript_21309/g.20449  ORF Transcript_21309/g.20449 Transcript_21309/m.20449 type:complete len:237 (-) Transcript_21309:324-1034(-)
MNNDHDFAIEVSDGEEQKSDEDEEEDEDDGTQQLTKTQNQKYQQWQQENKPTQKLPAQPQPKPKESRGMEEDDEDEEFKVIPGAYNPADYAGLQVSSEVKELFEYIQRYKPMKVDLETKIKPFVPEYIPAIGEVDSFLKMPKPFDTATASTSFQSKEDLGLTVLDEPALNCEDKAVLEMKYIQGKNVVLSGTDKNSLMKIEAIEFAEKKPKEIAKWIQGVEDLHKTRPLPTVSYTK